LIRAIEQLERAAAIAITPIKTRTNLDNKSLTTKNSFRKTSKAAKDRQSFIRRPTVFCQVMKQIFQPVKFFFPQKLSPTMNRSACLLGTPRLICFIMERPFIMILYSRELTVAWGESDPFGLVYYPMMFTWFNETEHELLRALGFPTNKLIKEDRTAFVMGDVHFRFVGPAAYGDKVRTTIQMHKMTESTIHWDCKAVQTATGEIITEGRAIRIHAKIMEDGNIKAAPIPEAIRKAMAEPGNLVKFLDDSETEEKSDVALEKELAD